MDKHQILVVDDEESIRHVLQSILEMKNCEVRQAPSAEAAVPMLEDLEPHVALVDIVMPGRNGLQLLGDIKRRCADTEVLIMTSNPSAHTAVKAMKQGAYDYLQKPFDLGAVWGTVQRALEHRRLGLKNRALLDEQERTSRELSSAISLGDEQRAAPNSPTYSDILDYFIDVVRHELEVDRVSLMLLDRATGELRIAASHGIPPEVVEEVRVRLGDGIAGAVAATGEPFLVTDATTDDRVKKELDPRLSDSFVSAPIVMSVPIKTDRQVLGVVNVTNRRSGRPFGTEDLAYLNGLTAHLAVAIEGAKRSERLLSAYETLKATQDQLVFAERIRAIGQMAAGVAHDFNNVLSVILTRAQVILRNLDGGGLDLRQIRADLEAIVKTSLQGAETIKRIQDYTRIRKDVPNGPVDINAVLRDAVEIARPKWKEQSEAEGRRIEVRFELTGVPLVSGNVYELTQVVGNLIFNAVEAMPEGGVLTFRTYSEGETVTFEVRDTGTGMDPETRERLFDPFFTTKASGQGLGTSVIYGIVARHRGEINVDSLPGEGSTFKVRLPRHEAEPEPPGAGREEADEELLPARLLLVDDDEMVRETHLEALTLGGHEVVAVSGGREALSALHEQGFDAVITDLSMSGMTGFELCKQIKAHDPGIPVILLSGWAIQQQEENVEEAGIAHVLVKPCTIEDLLGTVRQAVRNRETSEARTVVLNEAVP